MAGLLSPRPQLVSHSHTCSSVSSAHANTYFVFWYVHSVPWQLVRRRCLAAGRCCRMAGMPASFPASEPTGWGWWRPHQLQRCRGSGKHITAPSEAQARYVAAHACTTSVCMAHTFHTAVPHTSAWPHPNAPLNATRQSPTHVTWDCRNCGIAQDCSVTWGHIGQGVQTGSTARHARPNSIRQHH